MDERVEIRIVSEFDEQPEGMEVRHTGSYAFRNETHCVTYEEVDPESREIVKNILKIRDNEVRHIKRGGLNSNMRFATGYEHVADYATAVGMMPMKTHTHEVTTEVTEEAIAVKLVYDLYLNDQYISKCNLTINVQ